MADYMRYKSGSSDWTASDLVAYNISVYSQTPNKFYGRSLPTIASFSSSLDPNLLSGTLDTDGLSDETYRLLQYIDLASGANLGQVTVVDDFAREILRALGYEKRDLLFRRSRYALPLSSYGMPICGRLPQTSVSLVQGSSIILLVVQEDKTVAGISNPEPQIIREAIANFQWNNRIRVQLGEYELEFMTFPCIAMTGTRPIFYLVPVTRDLSEAVAASKYPSSPTVVQRCVVTFNRLSEGMETPDFRQLAFQHFIAFRTLAETHWSAFMIPEFPVETRKED